MRTGVLALAAGALVAALTGCAGAADSTRTADSSATTGSASPTTVPSGQSPARKAKPSRAGSPSAPATGEPVDLDDPDALAGLAELAEQQAGRRPELPPGPVLGADISWPQCPRGMGIPERRTLGLPMPLPQARYVVIGLTNGPAFTDNPCLADQVTWVRDRGLMVGAYAVTSFPDAQTREAYGDRGPFDADQRHGALRNVGYQQARFNIATMRAAGLPAPLIWIDVEPVRDFEWSQDLSANAAVVQGAQRGYAEAGYATGVYSTPYLWQQVVGDLTLGDLPEWRAAGQTSRAEALARCAADASIQGGPAAIGQWLEAGRDQNVTCPGTADRLPDWFHQF